MAARSFKSNLHLAGMSLLNVLLGMYLCPLSSLSAEPAGSGAPEASPIEDLADAARALPPELAADVLLRLSSAVPDRALKLGFLEEAFRLGRLAMRPFPLRAVLDPMPDSDEGMQALSASLGVDRLSLACRSIQGLLVLDPARALALFQELPPISLAGGSCDDALVPDVSDLYDTLVLLASRAFPPKVKTHGDGVDFVASQLRRISSALQAAPAAKAVNRLAVSPEERADLLQALAAAVAGMQDRDRSFSFAYMRLRLVENTLELAAKAEQEGIAPHSLVSAMHGYLVRQLAGKRCADTVEYEQRWRKIKDPVRLFAEGARRWLASSGISDGITAHPAEVAGRPTPRAYWEKGAPARFLAESGRLRTGGRGRFLTAAEKADPEWLAAVASYLSSVDSWQAEAEFSEASHFHMKCALYAQLLDVVADGPMYERVLRTYLAFLSLHRMRTESPAEWLWHINGLLKLARPLPAEEALRVKRAQARGVQIPGLPHAEAEAILREIESCRDPWLALYGRLERHAPQRRTGF
jgi:hypothetical protein